jgi:hypothetical protein
MSLSAPKLVEKSSNSTNDNNKKDYGTNKCMQVLCTRSLLCSATYFALAYFIQGITDIASGFVNLPLQTILKDKLRLTPSQMGTFFFSCTITYVIIEIIHRSSYLCFFLVGQSSLSMDF